MNDLIDRYLNNTCTEQERQVVEAFLQSYQNEKSDPQETIDESRVKEELWTKISTQALQTGSRKNPWRVYLEAAAALVICALSIVWLSDKKSTMIFKEAKNGEQLSIILPDQSTVLLNGGSSIHYPKTFDKIREVSLTGEAFFSIQRDPARPFIVKAGEVTTTVLGTSFTINTFSRKETSVAVITGKVEVQNNEKTALILTPGEGAGVDKTSGKIIARKIEPDRATDWMNNVLRFDEITMGEASEIMERWYDVKISFADKSLEMRLIKCDYKNQSLQNVIESLCFIQGMTWQKNGKAILFMKEEK